MTCRPKLMALTAALLITVCGCKVTDWIHISPPIPSPVVPVPAPEPPAPIPPVTPPLDVIDLRSVTWVHARGQDIASWPITATLDAVEFKLPNVCSSGMSWPDAWSSYGEKNVTANHVVLANIGGKWFGVAWEVLNRGVSPCRVLEVLRDGTPGLGPFAQVEQSPFMDWYPAKGERVCFLITSNIRAGVMQPVGRSKVVCATWP